MIATTPFEMLARKSAAERGAGDFPPAVLEHPIGGWDAAGIKIKADTEFDKIYRVATAWQPR